jgi:hypothetical protein
MFFRRKKPKPAAIPPKAAPVDEKTERLQGVITRWVDWYRSVNDPEIHRKVAERQIGMMTAEKQMSHYEIIHGGHQKPRAVLHVPDLRSLAALQWALARMFPRTRVDVHEEPDLGKSLCNFCSAYVRVPCTPSRARNCANRPRTR